MGPTQKFVDALYREEVERAKRMPAISKLRAGFTLFQRGKRMMILGIRTQFPQADDAEVRRLLRERLELGRRLSS